jgi:hypothetical protein
MDRIFVVTALPVVALFACSSPTYAQAWLPEEDQGAIAIVYQNAGVHDHLLPDGTRIDAGHIQSHAVLLDFTYGLTDRLALNVNIPYITSRYRGTHPHLASTLDDGTYHGTFQDFRGNVRYALVRGATAITPYIDVIVPSHHYDYWGHSGAGRRLAELQVGTYVGHVLTRLPGTFVQARYAYGFTQRPLHQYHDRSVADVEFGRFLSPRLRVFALSTGQYSHGGLQLTTELLKANPPTPQFWHHDQLGRASIVDAGGGAQFDVTPQVTLFGSYATTVAGRNGHALGRGLSLGLSWGFGRNVAAAQLLAADTKRALPRCLCQKGENAK